MRSVGDVGSPVIVGYKQVTNTRKGQSWLTLTFVDGCGVPTIIDFLRLPLTHADPFATAQCDEIRPKCSACARHAVECEYVEVPRISLRAAVSSPPPPQGSGHVPPEESEGVARHLPPPDPQLELRLMHQWSAHVSESFALPWDFWKTRAPLIAFDHRYLLDAIFSLSALHASLTHPDQLDDVDDDGAAPLPEARDATLHHLDATDRMPDTASRLRSDDALRAYQRRLDMAQASRVYVSRAMDAHRREALGWTDEDVEVAYSGSILLSLVALFTLSGADDDPSQWMRLACDATIALDRWRDMVGGDAQLQHIRPFYGTDEDLPCPELSPEFEQLLTLGRDYEALSDEDHDAYRKALRCIVRVHGSALDGLEQPLAVARRVAAMPSRVPARFTALVANQQPRALAMLAHLFACMGLLAGRVPWFRGIAARQVPLIHARLPSAWKETLLWPMRVAETDWSPRVIGRSSIWRLQPGVLDHTEEAVPEP